MIADALPDNGGYVAAAYLVFAALMLIYIAIMAAKLARLEKDATELNELADRLDERERAEPRDLAGERQ